ncbi:variable surface protein, partial [Plasmodium gonderi]
MDTSENKAHTFDFSNIFPKCRDGFQWNNVSPHGVVPNFLTKLCSNFNRDYRTVGTDVHPFAKDCQLVTYYLNHIYIKVTSIELNACCKYFFYKLKDLLSKYQWKCEDTKSCYEAMKSLSRDKEFKDQIYPLFSQCDSNLSDFNYDIYQIFKKLDVIYHALNEFKNKSCPNKSDLDKINNEKKFLERSQNKYSESFTQLLRNFNELFKTRVNELDRNKGCVKPFLSYIKEEEKIKGIIKIL